MSTVAERKRKRRWAQKYRDANRELANARAAEARQRNRSRINENARKWRAANRKRVKAAAAKYRASHPPDAERQKGYWQKWIAQNREKYLAYQREYRDRNKDGELERGRRRHIRSWNESTRVYLCAACGETFGKSKPDRCPKCGSHSFELSAPMITPSPRTRGPTP